MRALGAARNPDPGIALAARDFSSRIRLPRKLACSLPAYAAGRDLGGAADEHRSDSLPQTAVHVHHARLQTAFLRDADIRRLRISSLRSFDAGVRIVGSGRAAAAV